MHCQWNGPGIMSVVGHRHIDLIGVWPVIDAREAANDTARRSRVQITHHSLGHSYEHKRPPPPSHIAGRAQISTTLCQQTSKTSRRRCSHTFYSRWLTLTITPRHRRALLQLLRSVVRKALTSACDLLASELAYFKAVYSYTCMLTRARKGQMRCATERPA